MTNKQFPKDFIFGTALASYQVEGGIYNNDWTHWENKDSSVCAEPCNEACKHYEYYKQDIELLVELGIKAFRFPIEWSRIEPEEGKYNQKEIDHYVDKANLLLEIKISLGFRTALKPLFSISYIPSSAVDPNLFFLTLRILYKLFLSPSN